MSSRFSYARRIGGAMIVLLALACLLAPAVSAERIIATPYSDAQGRLMAPGQGVIPDAAGKIAVLPGDALMLGADYLVHMQADVTEDNAGNGSSDSDPDDAGWDWQLTSPPDPFEHSASASPLNLYGVTALGLYYGYLATGNASYLTAMQDAATAMAGNAGIRSASDLIFLMRFDDLPAVTGTSYMGAAKAKYDARILVYGSATALAQYIRDARHGQGYDNGIIGWDVGAWAVAAQMLYDRYAGTYDDDADDIAEVLYQDSFANNPGYFDIDEDDDWDGVSGDVNYWWYSLGITGLLDAFSASGNHAAELPGLASRITSSMYPSGAVSDSYGHWPGDESWQATAYAAMALAGYDRATFQDEIDAMCGWLAATQHSSGGWLYSSGRHYPEIGGEITSALYLGTSVVAPESPTDCLDLSTSCVAIPVKITRGDGAQLRGFSVTFTLANLALCGAEVVQGGYLSTIGETQFEVTGNGSGSYTVDCAILGGSTGATDPTGTLFAVNVGRVADGVGTLTVDSVTLRDVDNAPILGVAGPPASVTADTAPPATITNLAAVQVKLGNDPGATTKIALTFTVPGDAAVVEVYRAPYGTLLTNGYPEYDDVVGAAAPAAPAYPPPAPWVQTGVVASGQQDPPADRGFWYYVVFTKDACGNISAVSNRTAGTLNYHLGDTHNGAAVCLGDNHVGTADISHLGSNYGVSGLPLDDPRNCLDVGPTTDYSVDARPTTDNKIGFEDLMLFAMNYGLVSKGVVRPLPEPLDALSVETLPGAPGEVVARLILQGSGRIQGLSVRLAYEGVTPTGMTPGDLVAANGAAAFSPEPGAVDAAVLGTTEAGFTGYGVLATITFRLTGEPKIGIASIEARDAQNAPVSLGAVGVVPGASPKATELLPAMPNPFNPLTTLSYRLAKAADVELAIYAVDGRLVRVLEKGTRTAGEYRTVWDGTDDSGRHVSSGRYFMRLHAGEVVHTRTLTLLK